MLLTLESVADRVYRRHFQLSENLNNQAEYGNIRGVNDGKDILPVCTVYSIKDEEKYGCKYSKSSEGCHSNIEGKRTRRFNMQGIGRVPWN